MKNSLGELNLLNNITLQYSSIATSKYLKQYFSDNIYSIINISTFFILRIDIIEVSL